MNIAKINIPYTIRSLLREKYVRDIITFLYSNRKTIKLIYVPLPLAEDKWEKICNDPDHEGSTEFNSYCYKMADSAFLDQLFNLSVLSKINTTSNEDDLSIGVKIINPAFIYELYQWVIEQPYILNYGLFSLHTISGIAYFNDKKCAFQTGSGLFRVFKAFMESPNHVVDFETIFRLQNPKNKRNEKEIDPLVIHQIIKDIKKKFKMTDKQPNIFVSGENQYLLKGESI